MAGDFTTTDYEEVQILKAGFGMSPDVPAFYYMGISTTAINDDGTGLTEFSGSGYARVKIPAWSVAVLDPRPQVDTAWCRTHALQTVQFPNPSAQWWTNGTQVAPFLADASAGGHTRWHCGLTAMPRVYPGHPLTFNAPQVEIGLKGAFAEPVFCPKWRNGALNTLTGAAVYGGPPALYIAWVKGIAWNGFSEPSQTVEVLSPFPHFISGDPNYARLPLGSLVTPATQGDGRGGTDNANDKTWTVTPGHIENWRGGTGFGYRPVILDDPDAITDTHGEVLLDAIPAGWPTSFFPVPPTSEGHLWFGGFNSDYVPDTVADGDEILIPAHCLKFRLV